MTKEYLKQYLDCHSEIQRLQERIQTVKNELEGLKCNIITDMPKGGTVCDTVDELIDLKTTLIAEYVAKQKEHHETMLLIESCILTIKDARYQTILSMRYLDGRTWEYIAENMKLDLRWIYRLHGKALHGIKTN